jgi:hypothetical protein
LDVAAAQRQGHIERETKLRERCGERAATL